MRIAVAKRPPSGISRGRNLRSQISTLRNGTARVSQVEVAPLEELPPGAMKLVEAGLITIGVYNCAGTAARDRGSLLARRRAALRRGLGCGGMCRRVSSARIALRPRERDPDVASGVPGRSDVRRLGARGRAGRRRGAGLMLDDADPRGARASRSRGRRRARSRASGAQRSRQVESDHGPLPVRPGGVAGRRSRCSRSVARAATRRSGSPPARVCSAAASSRWSSIRPSARPGGRTSRTPGSRSGPSWSRATRTRRSAATRTSFDLVFLDAEKDDYESLFALARPLLEPGARRCRGQRPLARRDARRVLGSAPGGSRRCRASPCSLDRGLELSVVLGSGRRDAPDRLPSIRPQRVCWRYRGKEVVRLER